jgi:flavin reductase (DIM6/NTAB) family NADH-FMN oxidoreductase RutF
MEKDTLHNIRETGEFVVNIVTNELAEAMNITATELPPEVNEFERAGLTPVPSKVINVPRIAESPINFECKLSQIVTIGDQLGQGSLVIGEVVYFHIDDRVYVPDHKIDVEKLAPIARLSGAAYARINDLFSIERPPAEITSS